MCQFTSAKQIRTLRASAFLKKFRTEKRLLKVSTSKITGENTFNGECFEIDGNHGLRKDEKTSFWKFFQICDECLNTQTAKYVYLCFRIIVWFLQSVYHFQQLLETGRRLIAFYTKFWVNTAKFLASASTSWLLEKTVMLLLASKT